MSKTKKESKTKLIRRKMMEARKKKYQKKEKDALLCKKQIKTWQGQTLSSSKEMENKDVQDALEMVIVGSDVQALYPSLQDVDVAIICYEAVMKSSIRFDKINYRLASQYIAMNLLKEEQKFSELKRILPVRVSGVRGARPGVSASTESEENWIFPSVTYTQLEKKMMIATIIQIVVLVMMSTHVYSFDGKIFLQQEGGPIGLRSTCAVARVVMNEWDMAWLERMESNNIVIRKGERYMDDLRVFLRAIKPGWRWLEGGLYHCETWRMEDCSDGRSKCRRTGNVLLASMNDIMDFLVFTLEIHEDFEDQKLPTLDTVIYMEAGRTIHFEFFQKPMSSNLVLQASTALSETVKVASLKEEVVRRLKHTSERLGHAKRMETLEELSQMMMNSGHKPKFIKSILIGGILRFENKLKQSKLDKDAPGYKPLHQPSGRCKERLKNKVLKKNNWYREGPRSDVDVNKETGIMLKEGRAGKRNGKKTFQQEGKTQQITSSTVMFVPNTRGAILLNKLKEGETVWSRLTGFKGLRFKV